MPDLTLNRTRKRDGPLFRGRFKAIIVEADSYMLQLVRYIHLNPVKATLVNNPAAYPFSSHKLYLNPAIQLPWLDKDTVLSHFAHNSRLAFDRFVAEGNDKSLEAFYARTRFSPFLGSDSFLAALLEQMPKGGTPVARSEATPQFPDLPTLVRMVSQYFEVSQESLLTSNPGTRNLPRNVAIYLASRRAGFRHRDIEKHFDLSSNSAVTRVCQRLEKGLASNPQWQEDLRNIVGISVNIGNNLCQVRH